MRVIVDDLWAISISEIYRIKLLFVKISFRFSNL